MKIGQTYSHVLTQREQRALQGACDILIDEVFEDLKTIDGPKDILDSTLGLCLPERYLYEYTPLFLKKFVVGIIIVAWKLAQSEHKPLASLAEELAAWAIVKKAQSLLEMEEGTERKKAPDPFGQFINTYFEDRDFEWLFDDASDDITQEPLVAQALGITPLSLDDWFKPFSDESARIAHPYML